MSSYLVKTNTSQKKDLNRVLRFEAGRSSAGENASWGSSGHGAAPPNLPDLG